MTEPCTVIIDAHVRLDNGYRKDHWIDAACVGELGSKVYIPNHMRPLSVKATGHTSRVMRRPDKYGFPRRKPKGPSRVRGFKTGDIVRAVNCSGKYKGVHVGRVAVMATGWFVLNKTIAVKHSALTKLHEKDGYNYRYGEPSLIIIIVGSNDKIITPNGVKYEVVKRIKEKEAMRYLLNVQLPNG